jgi:hypothetical protein
MFNSPFANDIFQQATFTFKVQNGEATTDARGNTKTHGEAIAHTFKLSKTSPNLRREYEVAQLDELYNATVVDGIGILDPRIRPGDVGDGEVKGRKCICTVRSLAQSSINLIPEILGEKYLIQVSYRAKGGTV